MLHVGPFFWGSKYGPEYVERLRAGVARHLNGEYRWHVFSPDPRDEYLTEIKGCFCRLRAFDPEWQTKNGIVPGDRIVSIDLDAIVTGSLDPLFDRPEPFVILQNVNSSNPCPMNGSIWMLTAGYRPDVWHDFSLDAADKITKFEFADDQGWFWHKMPDAAGWNAGPESGIYGFQKKGWPKGTALPEAARLVVFPGWRDPAKFSHLDWIQRNWRV